MTSLEQRTKNPEEIVKGRILAVDDEQLILNMMKMLLPGLGYSIEVAENGLEGIDVYNTNLQQTGKTFDLILTDIQMPKMDGYEFAKAVKKADPNAVILAVSAGKIDRPELFVKSIHKPYTVKELEKELDEAMQYAQQTL